MWGGAEWTDSGGSGRKVYLSVSCEVTWAKLRLICMTRQSAGQWSEEAAGIDKLQHTQTFPCALMYTGDDKTFYWLAQKNRCGNVLLFYRVFGLFSALFFCVWKSHPPLTFWISFFLTFPNSPIPVDSFVHSSLETEPDIYLPFFGLFSLFNRLKEWPEVTASLWNNRLLIVPDHVSWESYYLPALNEICCSLLMLPFHKKVQLLSSLTTFPPLNTLIESVPIPVIIPQPSFLSFFFFGQCSFTENKFKCKQGKSA